MKIRFAAKLPGAAALCLLLMIGSLLAPPKAAGCRISFHFLYLGPNSSLEATYETVVADFDVDGQADLAVPLTLASTIQIYRGNGNGTFAAPVSYPANGPVVSIAAGDFNGDGKPDLAAAITSVTDGALAETSTYSTRARGRRPTNPQHEGAESCFAWRFFSFPRESQA